MSSVTSQVQPRKFSDRVIEDVLSYFIYGSAGYFAHSGGLHYTTFLLGVTIAMILWWTIKYFWEHQK